MARRRVALKLSPSGMATQSIAKNARARRAPTQAGAGRNIRKSRRGIRRRKNRKN